MRKSYLKSVLLAAAVCGFIGIASPANAAFVFNVNEVGSNVVITGSGSINLAGLTSAGPVAASANTRPGHALIDSGGGVLAGYTGITGPASFGSGADTVASSSSGDAVGISGFSIVPVVPQEIYVPSGYVTGSSLSDTSTYSGQTESTLGFTSGSYVYTWGSGPTADSLTVNVVPSAVPEPASLGLLSFGGLALLRRRSRRASGLQR